MTISSETLLAIFALQLALLFAMALPAWRTRGVPPSARLIGLAMLLTVVGIALKSREGALPAIVSNGVGPSLILFALCGMLRGLRQVFRIPMSSRADWIVAAVAGAVVLALCLVEGDTQVSALQRARMATHASATLALTAWWLRDLHRFTSRPRSLAARYLTVAACLSLAANVLRFIAALVAPLPREGLHAAVFVALGTVMVTSMLSMVGVILQLELRAREELKDANERLSRDAFTDSLTGIANRRRFETDVEIEIARSRRKGWPAALMLLDIDRFKLINDRLGHPTGDVVLREVAAVCQRELRSYDLIARWGGEEFAVLLPQCDLDASRVVAARMLAAVRALSMPVLDGARVTVSLGVAAILDGEDAFAQAIDRADAALYRAKRSGRDRFVVADDGLVSEAPVAHAAAL